MKSTFFRYIASAALLASMLLGITSCSGPKVIPDKDLVNIFHDAYIANAYISENVKNSDSLYIYEPIFERYGYTMEDLQHTIMTFTERKSAMLSDLMYEVNNRISAEAREEARKMVVLDTIDNIAKRTYTRTMYSDTLIRVKKLKDTTKLRITLEDIVPGEYTVSFNYLIDTLDENRNSRVEAYLVNRDTQQVLRHTMMLSRYREAKYSRKFTADTSHSKLYINMYYHPTNEESKMPDITIRDFKIVRVLPTEQSVDSLYFHQLGLRMLNHDLMMSFAADTLEKEVIEPQDTTAQRTDIEPRNEEKDSLALRTN